MALRPVLRDLKERKNCLRDISTNVHGPQQSGKCTSDSRVSSYSSQYDKDQQTSARNDEGEVGKRDFIHCWWTEQWHSHLWNSQISSLKLNLAYNPNRSSLCICPGECISFPEIRYMPKACDLHRYLLSHAHLFLYSR